MEAARQKLQARYKDVQTGGRGTIRRKKIPSKKSKHSSESEEVLKVLKLPNNIFILFLCKFKILNIISAKGPDENL